MQPFSNPQVAARFEGYPPHVRRRLMALRELVFRIAAATDGVGEIEESLKWGEPAYATRNKSGTTLRIDWKQAAPNHCAMYFHCQTNLVETFRSLFPNDFIFEGKRAMLWPIDQDMPRDALAICIAAAMTYHLKKKKSGQHARDGARVAV